MNAAAAKTPNRLPILPLRNMVLYPGQVLAVHIESSSGKKVVDDVLADDRLLVALTQRDKHIEEPAHGDLFDVGVTAEVVKRIKQLDGSYQVVVSAHEKARLRDFRSEDGCLNALIEVIDEDYSTNAEIEAMALNLRNQFEKVVELAGMPNDLRVSALNTESLTQLVYLVGSNLALSLPERQTLLEIGDIYTALEQTTRYITRQLEQLELGLRIQEKVKAGMDKRQREYYLREQLQAIRRELGDSEITSDEVEELTFKLEELTMPREARDAAEREIKRLTRISPASAEYTVSRNYLDWLLEMPWAMSTQDNLDVLGAEKILNEDHFDLEKVKRRILEYLAVLQLKKDLKGPILCFVGPPGVGKTSLGQSIARSLGRKFVRISLGGLRDEAEIRGHRRTYVGALPGRIIQGIKRADSNNPVFVLDEIDKLGMDFRGDPSSALLEVLDPEQNFSFSDHYLEVPFDLSKVIFIATCNMLDTIPHALRDRMEVIEIAGYTEEEKLEIAKKYLIAQQIENNGLTAGHVTIPDEVVQEIIRSYTREAGVRNLDRNLAAVCRNIARRVAEGRSREVAVSADDLAEMLGPVRFLPEMATRSWGPGVATGLAWTPSGGELIFIEALRTHGGGRLIMTGQLGEVMKESGTAALTYIRAHAHELGIEEDKFATSDIHVHVPAGAIPKDGPSAGVAMVVVLGSLISGRPVRRDIAMTGEITLRGDILPVGGIKEKVLVARRAGIREVIIPQANAKDLVDIAEHLREGMTFHEVQVISEVLDLTLT
jgi:ATP-dependent Lon protease